MSLLNKIHHTAVICSNHQKSKTFYIDVLGLAVIRETYREQRKSYKLDLALNGEYGIELFSFPNPPKRPSRPEATGLRHLAFEVTDLESVITHCATHDIIAEPIRTDGITDKRFTFINDPDKLSYRILRNIDLIRL